MAHKRTIEISKDLLENIIIFRISSYQIKKEESFFKHIHNRLSLDVLSFFLIFLMTTSHSETKCSICDDETETFICRGCLKDFCFDHLTQHRQFLSEQLGLIQNDYNQFKQIL